MVFPLFSFLILSPSPVLLQSLAPQLFAASLPPYIAFLYYLTKSGKVPKVTVFGFYFLLVFVGATIPAGIYGARACRLAWRKPAECSDLRPHLLSHSLPQQK